MRIGAAIVAMVALASLMAQWVVSAGVMVDSSPAAVVWRMLGYLTILGNLATLVLMARAAMAGRITARAAGVITVIMAVVGLVYHILLAGIWKPVGYAWWADQGLHTAVPVLVALWWVVYAPKAGLKWYDSVRWLMWPFLYADYAIVRGLASGFYPYPFMDISALGMPQVVLNVVFMAIAFMVLALLLIAAAKIIR